MKNHSPSYIWRQSKNISEEIGKTGKIVSFTQIFASPTGFEHQAPYFTGLIKFKNGITKPLEIIDGNEKSIKIDATVKTVVRRIGLAEPEELIRYGIKAKLLK